MYPLVRGQHVHQHIGGVDGNPRHHLERISEAHQPRSAPARSDAAERQRPVVEPRAMAESRAARVETDGGYEYGVEETGREELRAPGFVHAEGMEAAARRKRDELHAPLAQGD